MSVNIYDSQSGNLQNVASGQRTWVGTQEAYKAAKQAGTLPNNAIIAITDDEKDHNHYSTDETETGMYWIDGKPIYRKVIPNITLDNNNNITVAHGISNFGDLISLRGAGGNSQNATQIPIQYVYSKPSDKQVLGLINPIIDNTNLTIRINGDFSTYTIHIIIEYTKTTD